MSTVNISINNTQYTVDASYTVLEACRSVNIEIPTLCYLKEINEIGACRMCLVEVEGARTLQAACVCPVREGMVVKTNTRRVREARKLNLELILSNHEKSCFKCNKNGSCELRKLSSQMGIDNIRFDIETPTTKKEITSPSIVRNNNKCILCRRCVAVCDNIQTVSAITATNRGFNTEITHPFQIATKDSNCILCGQCIAVCPTGALREQRSTDQVWDAIEDHTKHVVCQIAPAVRSAIGEEFGYEIGTDTQGKMIAATKKLGFDQVFDTVFSADLTIMEEATELIDRVQNGGTLPMITSCSPGWVKFAEHNYPDLLDHLSSCKSPHMMFGATLKSYYAKLKGIDPKDIVVVSVMPCVAKKYEVERPEMTVDGNKDVDYVITTRELAQMIKEASIQYRELEDDTFDSPFGNVTGSGVIFGATGGVMEAALRTAADVLSGESQTSVDYAEVRGKEGVKEITVTAGDLTFKAAVCSGAGKSRELLEEIRKTGKSPYTFIEVMGCPGGCVMGGGQPLFDAATREKVDVFKKRASVLYNIDANAEVRKSHDNPEIKMIYDEFYEKPNSHVAHKYLHTTYTQRGINGNLDNLDD